VAEAEAEAVAVAGRRGRRVGGHEAGVVVVGEDEALCEQGLDDRLAVLDGYEDKVGV
jgi:hypothetical protein